MPYVSVKQAKKLTGLSDQIIRKWLREIILYGEKEDQSQVKKQKGKWRMDLALVDKLAERDRTDQAVYSGKKEFSETNELFGLPRLDHPLIGLLQRQLINKDQQMERMQNQMDAMLERNRELNVMLHKLQQSLGNGVEDVHSAGNYKTAEEDAKTDANPPHEEKSKTIDDGVQLGFQSRPFTQWLRSV